MGNLLNHKPPRPRASVVGCARALAPWMAGRAHNDGTAVGWCGHTASPSHPKRRSTAALQKLAPASWSAPELRALDSPDARATTGPRGATALYRPENDDTLFRWWQCGHFGQAGYKLLSRLWQHTRIGHEWSKYKRLSQKVFFIRSHGIYTGASGGFRIVMPKRQPYLERG